MTASICSKQMSGMSRLLTVVCFIGGDADDHFSERHRPVKDRCLKKMTIASNGAWIGEPTVHFLMFGAGDFVSLSQLIHEERRIGFDSLRFPAGPELRKNCPSRKRYLPRRSNQTGLLKRSRTATPAWFSPRREMLLHVFRVARPGADTRGLLRCIVQQQAHLFRAQARRASCRGSRAKTRCGAVRAAVSRRLVAGATETHGHARANVVAESDRPDKMRAADFVLFTGRKTRRNAWTRGNVSAKGHASRRFRRSAQARRSPRQPQSGRKQSWTPQRWQFPFRRNARANSNAARPGGSPEPEIIAANVSKCAA